MNDLRQTKNGRGLWPLFLLGALCAGVRGVPARQLWRGNGDAVAHRPPLAARGQPHRSPATYGPVASPFFARREPGAAAGTAPGACQQAPRIPACRRSSSGMEMGVGGGAAPPGGGGGPPPPPPPPTPPPAPPVYPGAPSGGPAQQIWMLRGGAFAPRPALAARGQPHRSPATYGPVAPPFFARWECARSADAEARSDAAGRRAL